MLILLDTFAGGNTTLGGSLLYMLIAITIDLTQKYSSLKKVGGANNFAQADHIQQNINKCAFSSQQKDSNHYIPWKKIGKHDMAKMPFHLQKGHVIPTSIESQK